MNNKTYNGYYNYETWSVALIIENDQALQEYWLERAQEQLDYAKEHGSSSEYWTEEQSAIYALAKELENDIEDSLMSGNDESNSIYKLLGAQLLHGALSEVNYDELAKEYIEQVKENAACVA
jgi:hypothetical protein